MSKSAGAPVTNRRKRRRPSVCTGLRVHDVKDATELLCACVVLMGVRDWRSKRDRFALGAFFRSGYAEMLAGLGGLNYEVVVRRTVGQADDP